jgi:hypothetical protein
LLREKGGEMTDDKGEGRYIWRFKNAHSGYVINDRVGNKNIYDGLDCTEAEDIGTAMNLAHAEGRKSMEKDFKELLEITQSLYDDIGYDSADCKKFRKWKKARGIE